MPAIGILNNIPALAAQNQLEVTQQQLQNTLFQLSSGSRINSGADDAAGLSIADGLGANITALNQSSLNANDGVGQLQVADGALSQVTDLLNRAVTLATEAGNGGLSASQLTALDNEFTSIKNEINNIGANTNFNGTGVFTASTTSIFLSDSSSSYNIAVTVGALSDTNIQDASGNAVDLSGDNLTSQTNAQTALTDINSAISNVSSKRGQVGATINQLQAAQNVISVQVQNLTASQNNILAANIPQVIGNLSRLNILNQTGISSLAQANSSQQAVLRLLQ